MNCRKSRGIVRHRLSDLHRDRPRVVACRARQCSGAGMSTTPRQLMNHSAHRGPRANGSHPHRRSRAPSRDQRRESDPSGTRLPLRRSERPEQKPTTSGRCGDRAGARNGGRGSTWTRASTRRHASGVLGRGARVRGKPSVRGGRSPHERSRPARRARQSHGAGDSHQSGSLVDDVPIAPFVLATARSCAVEFERLICLNDA